MRIRVHLTFPEDLVSEPIIYRMGKEFEVVPSIRRANVEEGIGWVILDLTGRGEEIEKALSWMEEQGIEVDVIERAEDVEAPGP
jgi:ABC-type methionine transport system ATPase subunit